MKILVTGGSGVIGAGAIPELLKAGHTVRMLSRGAAHDAREYPGGVEAFSGNIGDRASLAGAADGCDLVIHIAGIVEEDPPEATYEKVNVEGTANLIHEAERAGRVRLIYISSLGADTGNSDYHRSKRRAEEAVKRYAGEWLILRPGNVYGPGDGVISTLLKMVRNLPAVPVVGSGNQPFQPLWFEDLAQAIRMAANDRSLNRQVLELAGNEVVTTREVLDCLTELTGRSPERIPVPEWAAKIGTLVADNLFSKTLARIGLHLPLNSSKLQMLVEGNVIDSPDRNALISVFRISPTPLREGLISLADRLPELLLEDGIGPIERKRFWAEVCDSRMSHTQLMRFFREHITEVIPVNFAAEPNVPSEASLGATLTGAIPGRGFFQVRVEEETPDSITLATLEGHPLAGLITFKCQPHGEKVQFMVELYAHPSNFIDWLGMHLAGAPLQNQNWRQLVARVVELTGGLCPEGVQCDSKLLDEAEAEQVERRADDLVCARKREEHRAELSRA